MLLRRAVLRVPQLKMSSVAVNWSPKFLPAEDRSSGAPERASFRIVSYNILAQVYVKGVLFPHSPAPCLKWKNRSEKVLSRLLCFNADILCVQELDEFDGFYKPRVEIEGYNCLYVQRSGKKRDGCGILYKSNAFELLKEESVDYNDLVGSTSPADDEDARDLSDPRIRMRRNCVGVIAALRPFRCPDHIILVANTHLYWDPSLADVKLAQAKYLLWKLGSFEKDVSEKFNCRPLILVSGDFNSTPGDQVYNYLTSQSHGDVTGNFSIDSAGPSVSLRSLYASVQAEPAATNFTPGFTGTLDYIFFAPSRHLQPKAFLELPHRDAPEVQGGLPNHNHPSDHIPIAADFSIFD